MNSRVHRSNRDQAGLTLLEMVVVLAILAAMTTLAVRMTSGLVNETRYSATQKTLESFRAACIGGAAELTSGVAPEISSFIADVGRLPLARASGAQLVLDELYAPTASHLPVYGFYVATNNNTFRVDAAGSQYSGVSLPTRPSGSQAVWVPTGWRGPYIYLGAGVDWRDGWGKPIAYDPANPTVVQFWQHLNEVQFSQVILSNQPVARVVVLNGASPTAVLGSVDPYTTGTQTATVYFNEIRALLTVRLTLNATALPSGARLCVRVFGPNALANLAGGAERDRLIRCLAFWRDINLNSPVLSIPIAAGASDEPLLLGPKVIICELVDSTGALLPANQLTTPVSVFLQPGVNYVPCSIFLP